MPFSLVGKTSPEPGIFCPWDVRATDRTPSITVSSIVAIYTLDSVWSGPGGILACQGLSTRCHRVLRPWQARMPPGSGLLYSLVRCPGEMGPDIILGKQRDGQFWIQPVTDFTQYNVQQYNQPTTALYRAYICSASQLGLRPRWFLLSEEKKEDPPLLKTDRDCEARDVIAANTDCPDVSVITHCKVMLEDALILSKFQVGICSNTATTESPV